MDRDDDIARLLPEPPPPRPGGRSAAIARAMRRFDGDEQPIATTPPGQPAAPVRRWRQRTQIGAFASILLVAVIAIPLALQRQAETPPAPGRPVPAIERTVATGPARPQAPAPERPVPIRRASPHLPPTPPSAAARPEPEPQAEAQAEPRQAAPTTGYAPFASQDLAASSQQDAAPSPAAPRARMAAARPAPLPSAPIVVTGGRLAAPSAATGTPVTVAGEAESGAGEIIVTTARKSRARRAARRGDWNACTVQDPERSLRACKRLVDPGAKGDAGVAAARLADGLTRAWQGDWQGAIGALDQAVAVRPELAFAYLNRGLAHGQEGDLARAEADLDLAVRYAPHAARGYYNRGLVRRMRGNERGADADMARARELDTRYEALGD
ncbi:tetratricopeptide repeat protein [Sphingomonas leidyi]|nr:hypothetical protein [Sphingomonas leidyi]